MPHIKSAILKWTLNRTEQAENTKAHHNACDAYKPLEPSEILQSKKLVSHIMELSKEEYVNPFDVNIPNVIVKIWNSSHVPLLEEPDFTHNGWNSLLEICWMDEASPRDMNNILLEPLFDADSDIG